MDDKEKDSQDLKFEKRESWEIDYTGSDGEDRQIHCVNGHVHAHNGGQSVRSGNDSWDTNHDENLTETDKEIIQDVRDLYGDDWWKK